MVKQEIRTIRFDEKAHRYTDQYNKVYTPVTSQVEEYKEPFDKEYWSKKKAIDLGLTQKQVLDSWNKITVDACNKGNKIHKRLETSIDDSSLKIKVPNAIYNDDCSKLEGYEVSIDDLRKTPLALHYPKILKLLEFYIERGWKLYAEKRFYLADYLIAGTIDLILIKNKDFIIVDWKTNKDELKFVSGYYKKVNGVKTNQWVDKKSYYKFPLNKIEECKGNGYALQLSSYAWMVECWGFTCKGLILCHIKESISEVDIEKEKVVNIMKIPYLKNDIINMFNHRLRNNSNDFLKFTSPYSWRV